MIKLYTLQGVSCYPLRDVDHVIIHHEKRYEQGEHSTNNFGILGINVTSSHNTTKRRFTFRHGKNLQELIYLKENLQAKTVCEFSFELELE